MRNLSISKAMENMRIPFRMEEAYIFL